MLRMSSSENQKSRQYAIHEAYFIVEHKRKQLKYIAAGGAVTWFTDVLNQLHLLVRTSKGSAWSVFHEI